LIVGFAASPVACQHIDSFPPDYVYPVALQDGLRSITPYAPGVGASDQRFLLLLLSALTRRPRIAYGSSNIHDANDPASACGIDGLPKFLVFPLATSTRTSLASFEPLLPLLTCRRLSLFILLFHDPTGAPRSPRAFAQWFPVGGSLDLLS